MPSKRVWGAVSSLARIACVHGLVLGLAGCQPQECEDTVISSSDRPRGLMLSLDELSERLVGVHELPISWLKSDGEIELVAFESDMLAPDLLRVEVHEVGPFMQGYATGSRGCVPASIRAAARMSITSERVLREATSSENLQLLDADRGLRTGMRVHVPVLVRGEPGSGGLTISLTFDALGELALAEAAIGVAGESVPGFEPQ